jgi:hypothetical protein
MLTRWGIKVNSTERQPTKFSNEALAVRFAFDAEQYAEAAMALPQDKFYAVQYHLFCQAFELILKSFILSTGEDQQITFKIGHKLNKALSTAVRLGYRPSHPDLDLMVKWLSPFHEGHDFRYARGGAKSLPTPDHVIKTFRATHAEISAEARTFYLSKHPPDAALRTATTGRHLEA